MSAEVSAPERLKSIIINSLNLEGMTPDEIGDDEPLFGEGLGLDSVDALELVVAIEKEYKISIKSHEIDPKVFSSVTTLSEFIQGRVAEGSSA